MNTRPILSTTLAAILLSTLPASTGITAPGPAGAAPSNTGAPADLGGMLELAHHSDRGVAWLLGTELQTEPVHPLDRDPAAPLASIYARMGIAPETDVLDALDRLDPGTAAALTRTLEAFDHFQATDRTAFSGDAPDPARTGAVLTARQALLETLPTLIASLQQHPGATTIDQPPVLRIEPGSTVEDTPCRDSTYTADYALLIDLCGSDTYLNNAGGTLLLDEAGRTIVDCVPSSPEPSPTGNAYAALLVDVVGSDRFGDPDRGCGTNGGGFGGSGALVSIGCTDTYQANHTAVNGGGLAGTGLLLDLACGSFDATGLGANGGAAGDGVGTLISQGGSRFHVTDPTGLVRDGMGANGGGHSGGIGSLIQHHGPDNFRSNETWNPCVSTITFQGSVCRMTPETEDGYGARIETGS